MKVFFQRSWIQKKKRIGSVKDNCGTEFISMPYYQPLTIMTVSLRITYCITVSKVREVMNLWDCYTSKMCLLHIWTKIFIRKIPRQMCCFSLHSSPLFKCAVTSNKIIFILFLKILLIRCIEWCFLMFSACNNFHLKLCGQGLERPSTSEANAYTRTSAH